MCKVEGKKIINAVADWIYVVMLPKNTGEATSGEVKRITAHKAGLGPAANKSKHEQIRTCQIKNCSYAANIVSKDAKKSYLILDL